MTTRKALGKLVSLLGVLGFASCIAGVAGVWMLGANVAKATTQVFEKIDAALEAVGRRAGEARRRVQESEISADGVRQALVDWTQRKSGERMASRLDVEARAARLESGLRQVDHWLEVCESFLDLARQAATIASTAGARLDAASIESVLSNTSAARDQLARTIQLIKRLQQEVESVGSEGSDDGPIQQAAQIAVRVIATLGSIDERLARLESLLSQSRASVWQQRNIAHRWILAVSLVLSLLLGWMAAGQYSLCVLGWRR